MDNPHGGTRGKHSNPHHYTTCEHCYTTQCEVTFIFGEELIDKTETFAQTFCETICPPTSNITPPNKNKHPTPKTNKIQRKTKEQTHKPEKANKTTTKSQTTKNHQPTNQPTNQSTNQLTQNHQLSKKQQQTNNHNKAHKHVFITGMYNFSSTLTVK